MNMKFKVFTVLALSIVIVSCKNGTPSKRVDVYNPDPEKDSSSIVEDKPDISSVIRPNIVKEDENLIKEESPERPTSEFSNPVKSKKFYEGLLEDFCKKYYHKKFPGRTYIYGSLRVESDTKTDEKTVEVKGIHSFKGRLGIKSYNDKEFRATVRSDGDNNFHIKFDRRLVKPISGGGEWVSTGDLPINYNP